MHGKVWDEIIYPFPNMNGATVEGWEWMSNFIPHVIMDAMFMLGLKLIHISKRGTWTVNLSGVDYGIFRTNRISIMTAGASFTNMV